MRNAARNHYRDQKRRFSREVSLDALEPDDPALWWEDAYSEETQEFWVQSYAVRIQSERLARALCRHPARDRDILLLAYFWGMNDAQIGKLLNLLRRTVTYRRQKMLEKLRKEMEEDTNA